MNERAFVGLDVNRNGIQAVVRPSGEKWVTGIDDSGISETAKRLSAVHPDVVVMEAHGGLELPVAGTLATVGLPLALVSPQRPRFCPGSRSVGGRDHAALLAHLPNWCAETPTVPESLVEHLKNAARSFLRCWPERRTDRICKPSRRNHIFF
jgi:hypothetical protein